MRTLTVVLSMLVLVCAAVYAELVVDARVPHGTAKFVSALSIDSHLAVAEYQNLKRKMDAQYGARSKTSLEIPPGKITVTLDDKIIDERMMSRRFSEAIGVFALGPAANPQARFPFRLAPDQDASKLDHELADALKDKFGKRAPAQMLAFGDGDWDIGDCTQIASGHLGLIGRLLPYRGGTACVVSWRGARPATMLVSVSIADGDPWMRPFTRRICRMITEAALAQSTARAGRSAPNYAACLLADRPTRQGTGVVLSHYLYELHPDGVALLD